MKFPTFPAMDRTAAIKRIRIFSCHEILIDREFDTEQEGSR
jgi:hypothetical protein